MTSRRELHLLKGAAPVPLRLPKVHRAPDEFDELPHELPDGSVGWTTNPERSRE